jgi:hypothetical protein
MRQRSLPRYLVTYLGQFLLTLVILNIFAWGFARFAADMITPGIVLPALLALLPPLMTGAAFRRVEGRRPAAGEVLALSVLSTAVALALLTAIVILVRRFVPGPLPELPAGLTETKVALIAAGAFFAGGLIFVPLGGLQKQRRRA